MENKEIREKLLYVLRNNIQDFEKNIDNESWYTYYKLNNLYLTPHCIHKEVIIEPKYFWQKKKMKRGVDYHTLCVTFENFYTYLTKEEYEEIMKIREEKIKEKQLEELTKLCKNN